MLHNDMQYIRKVAGRVIFQDQSIRILSANLYLTIGFLVV